MPELPEVETTRRGVEPHILGQSVKQVLIRQAQLRWPIPADLPAQLREQSFKSVRRRGKYLLLEVESGTVIMHLGMSGSLRIVQTDIPPEKHDHVDIILQNGITLRYRDPRRFGAVLWTDTPPDLHPLLASLGPEPLGSQFNGNRLFQASRNRRRAIKSFIMDSQVVVGVGNIYASEALFRAGIAPNRAAGRISSHRYQLLVKAVRDVLTEAIQQGGTSLRDFVNEAGQPGYFQQTLQVYGKAGDACTRCKTIIRVIKIAQRASFYCPECQH